MQQPTFLAYKNYRDLRASALLMAVAMLAYAIHHPEIGPYGGTWLGYTLGGTGIALIFFLLWYGIHKRRIPVQQERRGVRDRSSAASHARGLERRANRSISSRRHASTRQGWLSAHVYFGLSLIVLITLHSGFNFGWNIHTLAYGLLLLVIFTGIYGVYAYIRFPMQITENLGSETLTAILNRISSLDERAIELANQMPEAIRDVVRESVAATAIGGSVLELLMPDRHACPTSAAVKTLHDLGKSVEADQSAMHRDLYSILLRKEALVHRARRDISLRAKLDFWLYFHVPLAIALVAALIAHIISVFFYW